jgi:hypothetical protein
MSTGRMLEEEIDAHEITRSRLAAAQAEIETLRRDAERYRWLRDKARTGEDAGEIFIGVDSPRHPNRWALFESEADAAIDAAKEKA